jgi:ABC-type dipeptide/oligopeptide/nickel transport system permease subunit
MSGSLTDLGTAILRSLWRVVVRVLAVTVLVYAMIYWTPGSLRMMVVSAGQGATILRDSGVYEVAESATLLFPDDEVVAGSESVLLRYDTDLSKDVRIGPGEIFVVGGVVEFVRQYSHWLTSAASGEFGYYGGRSVGWHLVQSTTVTGGLVLGALALSAAIASLMVLGTQRFPRSLAWRMFRGLVTGLSGIHVLIIGFAAIAVGLVHPNSGFSIWLIAILAVGSGTLSDYYWLLQNGWRTAANREHVRAARARGASGLYHTLRYEATLTAIHATTSRVPSLLAGTIMLEWIFAYLGLGFDVVEAVKSGNFELLMGVTLAVALILLTARELAEATGRLMDPRPERVGQLSVPQILLGWISAPLTRLAKKVIALRKSAVMRKPTFDDVTIGPLKASGIAGIAGHFHRIFLVGMGCLFLALVVNAVLGGADPGETFEFVPVERSESGVADGGWTDLQRQESGRLAYGSFSMRHPMGTDGQGRDVLVRVSHAAFTSLWCGYREGRWGRLVDHLAGVVDSFPVLLLLLLAVIAVEGLRIPLSLRGVSLMFLMGLISAPKLATLISARVRSLKESSFVEAAVALGLSPSRIIGLHILWLECRPLILAQAAYMMGQVILVEATLTYLNCGFEDPTVSWGLLLRAMSPGLLTAEPPVIAVLVAMTLIIFLFQQLAVFLTDILDGSEQDR